MPETVQWQDQASATAGASLATLYDVVITREATAAYIGSYLRMDITNGGYYGGVRLRTTYTGTPDHLRVRLAFRLPNVGERYPGLWFRSTGLAYNGNANEPFEADAYRLSFHPGGNVDLLRYDASVSSVLTNVLAGAYSVNEHVEIVVDSIRGASSVTNKVKHWKRGTTEPTTGGPDGDGYQLKHIDTSAARKDGSRLSLAHLAGNPTSTVDLDSLVVAHVTADVVAPSAGTHYRRKGGALKAVTVQRRRGGQLRT